MYLGLMCRTNMYMYLFYEYVRECVLCTNGPCIWKYSSVHVRRIVIFKGYCTVSCTHHRFLVNSQDFLYAAPISCTREQASVRNNDLLYTTTTPGRNSPYTTTDSRYEQKFPVRDTEHAHESAHSMQVNPGEAFSIST